MSRIPSCLIGAGALGHTWVTTLRSNGDERLYAQTSFGADAARSLDEYKGTETRGDIYERTGRRKWTKRSRAYALLDQPTDGRLPYEPASEEADAS